MLEDEGDGAGQVLAGELRVRPVDDREPIDAGTGQMQAVWEGVVHGSDVGESASRAYHGKRCRHAARSLGSEAEEPRVGERGVVGLLGIRVDVIEDRPFRCAL